jgi:hypothetical protein
VGTSVTYTLRLSRDAFGPAGTVSTRIMGFGLVVQDAWLTARTVGP